MQEQVTCSPNMIANIRYVFMMHSICMIVTCKLRTNGSSQEMTGCGIGALNGLHLFNV